MKTSAIRWTTRPAGPGPVGDPWSHYRVGSGAIKFEAPTNAVLRVEVKDWYGRDFGAIYAAEFQPGSTPISHEFKIKP
jgi:hypothetical protein